MDYTFENLPKIIQQLSQKIDQLENSINTNMASDNPDEQLLTISDASDFLKLSINTLYGYTYRRLIPYYKKGGRLYFSKQQLIQWVTSGKKRTLEEISEESDSYLGKVK